MASFLDLLNEVLKENSWDKENLHPSVDLQGCLRRTCLDFAGAEQRTTSSTEEIRKVLGRQFHRWLQWRLEKMDLEVENEVKVKEGLPEGWSGSADTLLKVRSTGETWLLDYKTVSSVQLYMADLNAGRKTLSNKDNSFPSESYVWQLSAYFHALNRMGREVDRAMLIYVPIDTYYDRGGRKHQFEPRQIEIDPIPEDEVFSRMDLVSEVVGKWKKTWKETGKAVNYDLPEHIEPEQKLIPKPSWKNPQRYELHQKLDWRCRYCPFFQTSCHPPVDDEKLGEFHYEEGEWVYKPDIAGIDPLIKP